MSVVRNLYRKLKAHWLTICSYWDELNRMRFVGRGKRNGR